MTGPTTTTLSDGDGSSGLREKIAGASGKRIVLISFAVVAFFIISLQENEPAPTRVETIVERPIKRLDRSKTPLDVTLTLSSRRTDRMGSRIQLPLSAWLVARYHGWKFCTPPDPMAEALSFPICNETFNPPEDKRFNYINDNITKPGVYYIHKDANLWGTIAASESKNVSMYDDGAVEEWRDMILGAQVRPELDEELWISKDSMRIALHVRRGDITPQKRNDAWIDDDSFIALIELAQYYIRMKRGPDIKIEVHLFSESYGVLNWTRYDNLVDKFHLAPMGSSDIQLNLRDWKHFVLADVLIIGGSFSHHPARARPNPSADGFPMTLYRNRMLGVQTREWITCNRYRLKPQGMLWAVNFPTGTVTAKINLDSGMELAQNSTAAVNLDSMIEGLCVGCQYSAVPGAYKCVDRIRRYGSNDYTQFREWQKKVGENSHCTACNPDTCPIRVEKRGPRIPINSIIGIEYEKFCPKIHHLCREEEIGYMQ